MKNEFNSNLEQEEIYALEDVFTPQPNIFHLCVIFYILEGMRTYINFSFKEKTCSIQKLLDDINQYMNWLIPRLAKAIYDYTVLVVYGEMRYTNCHGHYYKGSYNEQNIFIFNHPLTKVTSSMASRRSYRQFIKYGTFYNPDTIKETAYIIFNPEFFKWDRSYGGTSWLDIAHLIDDYKKMSNFIFIDRAFDTQHNGGVFLDKATNIFDVNSTYSLKDFLDEKQTKDIFSLIYNYYGDVDYKTMKLIQRFYSICKIKHEEEIEKIRYTKYYSFECYIPDIYNSITIKDYGIKLNHMNRCFANITMRCHLHGNLTIYALEHRIPIEWGNEDFRKSFYNSKRNNYNSNSSSLPF